MIKGFDGVSPEELEWELDHGACFVAYEYCISVFIISFHRTSDPVFVRHNEDPMTKGLSYTLLTLFAGWWGIPFGPIFSIMSLYTNFRGGKDVTDEVLYHLGF